MLIDPQAQVAEEAVKRHCIKCVCRETRSMQLKSLVGLGERLHCWCLLTLLEFNFPSQVTTSWEKVVGFLHQLLCKWIPSRGVLLIRLSQQLLVRVTMPHNRKDGFWWHSYWLAAVCRWLTENNCSSSASRNTKERCSLSLRSSELTALPYFNFIVIWIVNTEDFTLPEACPWNRDEPLKNTVFSPFC